MTLTGAQALYGDRQGELSDADFLAQMNGATTRPYTVQWEAGTFYNEELKMAMFTKDYKDDRGVVAGKHFYRIIDNATGSVICYKHAVRIDQDELEDAAVSVNRPYALGESISGIQVQWEAKNANVTLTSNDLLDGTTITIAEHLYEKYTTSPIYEVKLEAGTDKLGLNSSTDTAKRMQRLFYNNYSNAETATATYKYKIIAACRDNNGIYYPSVCVALLEANKENSTIKSIYAEAVMEWELIDPDTGTVITTYTYTAAHKPASGEYGFDHLICHGREVPSGVTLFLPYSASDSNVYKGVYGTYFTGSEKDPYTPELIHADAKTYGFVDTKTAYTQEDAYLKNSITVAKDVTLENNGNIIIPGVITGGSGGKAINSATVREHSRIYLGEGATLNNTGKITCHGYIDEVDDNDDSTDTNGSQVLATGGVIEAVLSVVEHRGGSAFSAMATSGDGLLGGFDKKMEDCAPFNRFYIETITSELVVQEGATVNGFYNMYVRQDWDGTVPIFGSDSSCFIMFDGTDGNKKSQVRFRYNKNMNQNQMQIEGNVSINQIGLKIEFWGAKIDLSTGAVLLPLSHYWDIQFKKFNTLLNKDLGEADCLATVSATSQDIKILPGASVVVDKGVTLKIGQIAVYSTSDVITNGLASDPSKEANDFSYYAKAAEDAGAFDTKYSMNNGVYVYSETKAPPSTYIDGRLVINGTLIAEALGGCVQTEVADAVIDITGSQSVKSKDVDEVIRNSDTDTKVTMPERTFTAKAYLLEGTTVSEKPINLPENIMYYKSVGSAWIYQRTITVSYDVDDSDNTIDAANAITPKTSASLWSNVGIDLKDDYITAPTRTNGTDFYTFVRWVDEDGNSVSDADPPKTVYSDISLIAEWDDRDDLKGTIVHNCPDGTVPEEFDFSTDGTKSLPDNYVDPTGNGYKLQGWYLDEACETQPIEESISGEALIANGYKVYAKWVLNQVEVTFVTDTYKDQLTFTKVTADNAEVLLSKTFYDQANHKGIDDINRNIDISIRFSHWVYVDVNNQEHKITSFNELISVAPDETEWELKAVWVDKGYTLNLKNTTHAYGITFNDTVYIDESQLSNNVLTLSNLLAKYEEKAREYDKDVNKSDYFKWWATDNTGATQAATIDFSNSTSADVYATWATKYTIKVEEASGNGNLLSVGFKIMLSTTNSDSGIYHTTDEYNGTMSIYITPGHYFKFSNADNLGGSPPTSNYTEATKDNTYTIKKESTGSGTLPCFTPDTLITLADGTQKRIDELTFADQILAWDFFTGRYVIKDISLLVYHGEALNRIANIVMSDGTILRIVGEHGVFDYDLNRFVYITPDNVEQFIGHRFVQYSADGTYNIVEMIDGYATEEYCGFYSISSSGTSNAFASGLLTVAPPEDFYNWIEMGDKLMYNAEQFQRDIETYGLYTYDDFKDYVTYEQFIDWNGAYLKIAVEKGYFTFEYILELIELYKGWMPSN